MTFSIIATSPAIRAIVQDGALERAFHDALFPRMMFRPEAVPRLHPGNVGDNLTFTRRGLIAKTLAPLTPGVDMSPSSIPFEQWQYIVQKYGNSIDVPMPTSAVAIADLFLAYAQAIGMTATESLNDLVRNTLYNAALSGSTVVDGAQTSSTTIRVKRINGFTTARRPDLAAGSAVAFATVTGSNPLQCQYYNGTVYVAVNVIGYTADNGDTTGPGVLTTDAAITVSDRAVFRSLDRSYIVRVGGGDKVDSVTSSSLFRLQDIRSAIARLRGQNVPAMPDGTFHCHLDTTSESQIFSDPETQRLNTSLPDWIMYREFAVGKILSTTVFENTKCPNVNTVIVAADGITFSPQDNFAGELYNNNTTTGVPIHRPIFVGQEAIYEHYLDQSMLISDAGITGKIATPQISNNGIEVPSDRIRLIFRAPLDRSMENVAVSWTFYGTWSVGTDVTAGDAARFKRLCAVEHGE